MAEPVDVEQQRAADRRLALLALIGEQPAAGGSCLEPEELAALVEGRLEPEQVEPCLAHLAGCDHCTTLWLQLDREWQAQRAKDNRSLLRLIRRPRVLATAGSLLAAAASIAVFLTLTTQVDRHTLTRLPEKSLVHEEVQPSTPEHQTAGQKVDHPPPAPPSVPHSPVTAEQSLAPSVQPAEDSRPKARRDATESEGISRQKSLRLPATVDRQQETQSFPTGKTAPLAESRGTERRKEAENIVPPASSATAGAAVPQPAPLADRSAGVAPLSLAEWHHHIRRGCADQPTPGFLHAISREGNQLLDSSLLSGSDRKQVEQILTLLQEQHPTAHQCGALLEILGPAREDGQR